LSRELIETVAEEKQEKNKNGPTRIAPPVFHRSTKPRRRGERSTFQAAERTAP
jgi:hypothetical protein